MVEKGFSALKKGLVMMKGQSLCKIIGVSVLAFGFGVLISFFLPETFLAVLEAVVIVAVGTLFFLHK